MYPTGRRSDCKRNRVHRRRALRALRGTSSTLWGFIAFFGSHLLAMHVVGRVKTSALLTGDF